MPDMNQQSSEILGIPFDVSITSGSSAESSVVNSGAYALECWAVNGGVFVFSAANSLNNCAAYVDSLNASSATGTIPGRHQFRIRLVGTSCGPWVQPTDGVMYNGLVGTADKPFFFASPFRIMPKETIKATLFNDSGATVRDRLTLLCRRINPNNGQPI